MKIEGLVQIVSAFSGRIGERSNQPERRFPVYTSQKECCSVWYVLFWLGLLTAFLMVGPATALAAPYTDHFDLLIAELQLRSAELTNTEDKIEVKQKKAVDKVLATFEKKTSTSLDGDLKLAKTAASKLAKAFPGEFATGLTAEATAEFTNLADLLHQALDAFGGDIEALLAAAQEIVDSAFPGKCQDKAQAVLDTVRTYLDIAAIGPDLNTIIGALGKAAKSVLKGQSLAEAALECKPNIGGDWNDWYWGMTVNGVPVMAYDDALVYDDDEIGVTYFANGGMFAYMFKADGSLSVEFSAFLGSPPSGIRNISGSYTQGGNRYTITQGTLNIGKFPSNLPNRWSPTFFFTATGTAGAVEVTGGWFSVWLYEP